MKIKIQKILEFILAELEILISLWYGMLFIITICFLDLRELYLKSAVPDVEKLALYIKGTEFFSITYTTVFVLAFCYFIIEIILTEKGCLRVFFQWCPIFILLGIFVKFPLVITIKSICASIIGLIITRTFCKFAIEKTY